MQKQSIQLLPNWVPEEACRYLDHTEAGRSIRQLARSAGCHPSTVLRQVRRIETRRDDPLVDGALQRLASDHYDAAATYDVAGNRRPDEEVEFKQKAIRVLRGLCYSGAILALADGMEMAVVVRDAEPQTATKIVVKRSFAEALALLDWISCETPGRISRYHITATGRSAVSSIMADVENRALNQESNGFSDDASIFTVHSLSQTCPQQKNRRVRYGLAESPLDTLSRLLDRHGNPFLSACLVQAGERLREDFELAQIGDHLAQGRAQFSAENCGAVPLSSPAKAAKVRATAALNSLGPGLSDVALRCCCHLEGLEATERQMGWSARSGKVVLRIALQQLKAHYDTAAGSDELIG
ncbi:helix-turn-helix domain-containing protein [Parasedimentitalea maritima]|uniref:Helix-turn-helix domain-containing protein n=1 Tax=Parasedimentitalea maritima TaxID=2578117 RepID=A0ABY2UVB0_9RHOB|nr:DUF6456 domain-containing protein [Zongyanglinia marina]TLP64314.1 helix-turn-helix domain-containing protein [Zongyanglinia marina]